MTTGKDRMISLIAEQLEKTNDLDLLDLIYKLLLSEC